MRRLRPRPCLFAFALPALAAALLLAGCDSGRPGAARPAGPPVTAGPRPAGPAAAVVTVDGAPVDLGEFRLTLAADEPAARRHFATSKSAAADFWTAPVGGVRPIDWLKKQALTDAVRNKAAERLGQQRHIADVLDYPALLNQLDAENQRRAQAVSDDQPVYGPQRFDLPEFYDLWLSNLKMHLIDTLPGATGKEDGKSPQQSGISPQQGDKDYAAMVTAAVSKAKVVVSQPVYAAVGAADLNQ
ncbi:hypothetical protein [Streptomyces sp. CA-111067]|uniref:hypothetical protein n=1 Tax=Streptomyces sp. CA-111067 TaxID=3240046 RepID=UPI003D995396